jgi:2-oxoglutarate dehydrogenase E2 component (dihydrolipoamide succinyltransferase)
MNLFDIVLPAMGEGIIEATITRWLVTPGDSVSEDQSLVEIATDKVDSEIPSPKVGRVKEILFKEGETPQVGQVIAILEIEGATSNLAKSNVLDQTKIPKLDEPAASITLEADILQQSSKDILPTLSPLVRSIAKQEGIAGNELLNISGTGLSGRITRDDILIYIEKRKKIIQKPIPSPVELNTTSGSSVEIIQMDRMRKIIADHMVMSKQTSAHVTSFIEADVTNLVSWRNREKDNFFKRENQKLTLTPLFIQATVKALRQYPLVNSSVEGDKIFVKRNINVGIATALPNGNLIVPVIKDADKLSLSGLAGKVNDLAQRARDNKLQPDEIQGGTFTITNLGMFETLSGTPIINQPQVAILAIGAINKKVVVVESEMGDTIAIRQIAMLSLSYDHRVIDGALGGMFLKSVRDNIQNTNI